MNIHAYTFKSATPVWEQGASLQMNRTVAFCADIPMASTPVILAAAASCSFVLLVNGQFVAHGPARAAHGYFRVDEYDLTPYLTSPQNRVCLRVAGYNVNSFSFLNQPSFLCAEIYSNGQMLAATGKDGFVAYGVDERVTKCQRYSFQRTFTECYRLSDGAFDYITNPNTTTPTLPLEAATAGTFICRDMPYCDNEKLYPLGVFQRGTTTYSEKDAYYNAREVAEVGERILGFKLDELDVASHILVGQIDPSAPIPTQEDAKSIALPADSYADLDLGVNYTGIYDFTVEMKGQGELFLCFDEVLLEGVVNPFRMGTSAIITVQATAGSYHVVCAEPYVMRYLRLYAKGCDMTVSDLHLRHIAFPQTAIQTTFVGDDATMQKIYDAALETFRANTLDIYMDCPSRERAGWLCDSFFTSRVEKVLTGKSQVERAFLENFILPPTFEYIPQGMLPMCYPSDHYDRTFIPNWAMWYVVELGEYLARTNDRAFIDAAKQRMYDLYGYFLRFENEYGLLEKLESWVFLEWSKSNELTQDVSFASNMLYAVMLDTMGDLYDDTALKDKATALRATINQMAMTPSGFYCDNALRINGQLVLTGERTESCQYYAFFTNTATPDSHPDLWKTLVYDFGHDRAKRGLYPEIWPANAFIGNYLRLDLLERYGYHKELYDNIKGYFAYMAEQTGTLWENVGAYASCNHGFASHVIYWMDILGLISHQSED